MSSIGPLSSFAICRIAGAPNTVLRLRMDADAQASLDDMVESHLPSFVGNSLNRVAFDPTFQADEEHVISIEGFELPDHIRDAVATPDEVPAFTAQTKVRGIRAIFHVGQKGRVVFQCWRNFDLLGRRKILSLLSKDTFQLEDRTPFVIERRIDAVYWDGSLFFRSYANASSMLDMLNYVAEATEADIEAFKSADIFDGTAADLSRCSGLHRRRIRLIVMSEMLKGQTVDGLYEKACEVDYALPVRDGKVVIPSGGQELSDLLSFLGEKIYRGPITGFTYLSTSSRRRQAD